MMEVEGSASALRATERKPWVWSVSPLAAALVVDQPPLLSSQGTDPVGKQMSTCQCARELEALFIEGARGGGLARLHPAGHVRDADRQQHRHHGERHHRLDDGEAAGRELYCTHWPPLRSTQQLLLLVQPAGTRVVARLPFWSIVKTKESAGPLPVAVTV
jgi:hypothetical protein